MRSTILIFSLITIAFCSSCQNISNRDMVANEVMTEYSIDTTKNMIFHSNTSEFIQSIKTSIEKSDFIYMAMLMSDTITLKVSTGNNKNMVADVIKENVIIFLNTVFSNSPSITYKIFKGVDKNNEKHTLYIAELTTFVNGEVTNLVRILFIIENDKVITIQLY